MPLILKMLVMENYIYKITGFAIKHILVSNLILSTLFKLQSLVFLTCWLRW